MGSSGGGFTSAMHPRHDVYGTSFHIPSPRDYDERIRELEAVGAEVQDSFESESAGRLSKTLKPSCWGKYGIDANVTFASMT